MEIGKKLDEYDGVDGHKIVTFSKHQIENLKKDLQELLKIKYKHRKGRLLGNMSKAMPDCIFEKLLQHVKDEELHLIYLVQGIQGCRIGDILTLKKENIDLDAHSMRIYNHKEDRFYSIPLNKVVESNLVKWMKSNSEQIRAHCGYLFFSRDDIHHKYRKNAYLSSQFVNRKLIQFLDELKLNKVYALRKDGGELHLYTTHSGRGHAATRIYSKHHNLKEVQQLLDHSPRSVETTMLYLENEQDLEKDI